MLIAAIIRSCCRRQVGIIGILQALIAGIVCHTARSTAIARLSGRQGRCDRDQAADRTGKSPWQDLQRLRLPVRQRQAE